MFSKFLNKFINLFRAQKIDQQSKQYLNYLKASYPNNHNYKVKKYRLLPYRELAKRYKRIHELLPDPLTSLLDIGCSKGFFVFTASNNPHCLRCLGIDIYQHDIDVCRWLKNYLSNSKVQFEFLHLHELANRIEEFGGPFQTVLMLNMYQYLYFGSIRCPNGYFNHQEIFTHLRKICSERIIFNNMVNLTDCQNSRRIQKENYHSQYYTKEYILAAAETYFNVVPHGTINEYPLWTMDVKENKATATSMIELKEVFEVWTNDLLFRENFKKNPEKALQEAGFNFDTDKLQKIKSLLKKQESSIKSESLDKRMSR